MANEITNEQLVAYIYDELTAEEAQSVRQLLKKNPEARQQYEALINVKKELGKAQDVEVDPPMILFSGGKSKTIWMDVFRNPMIQKISAIAAVILLLLVVGRLTGLQVQKQSNAITIGFSTPKSDDPRALDAKNLVTTNDSMRWFKMTAMQEELVKENNALMEQMELFRERLSIIQADQRLSKAKTNNSNLDEKNLNDLVRQLSEKNYQVFAGALEASNLQQEDYIKTLFGDFALYLDEQRNQDLRNIHNTLINLKQESDIKTLETEEVIAKLIKSVNDKNY